MTSPDFNENVPSALDLIAEVLEAELTEVHRIPIRGVKGREGWELEVKIGEAEKFGEKLRKFAAIARGGKNRPDSDFDGYINASLVISEATCGIWANGKLLIGDDGERLTFRSKSVIALTGKTTSAEAARRFLANDAVVIKVSAKILELAGYDGTDLDTADPDQGRSDG